MRFNFERADGRRGHQRARATARGHHSGDHSRSEFPGHHGHGHRRFGAGGFGGGFGGRGGFGPRDGGGSGGGGHHGRRGRRGRFDAESLGLILLKLIEETPRHGYDLIREIEARSGGVYAPSPGVVYPTLALLSDQGHAQEQPEAGGRKLYAITAEGRAHLEANAESLTAATARLEALAAEGNRISGAPIRRSMENLAVALRERLGREGASEDTALDIAAILDDAAQKIERLK